MDLVPIVVSGPLPPEPAFPALTGRFTPREPALDLQKGLWSDPNALLYEYSPMRQRYRAEGFSDKPDPASEFWIEFSLFLASIPLCKVLIRDCIAPIFGLSSGP